MELGFGQLVKVMTDVHPGVAGAVVQARLKYFQRIPFPSASVRVGTGGRAEYPAQDFMKLVIAMELLAAGIAPLQAASFVDGSWTGLGPHLAEVWRDRRRKGLDATFMIVRTDGLEARRGGTGRLEVGHAPDVMVWLQSSKPADRRLTLVDVRLMLVALEAAMHSALKMHEWKKLGDAIDVWAEATVTASERTAATGT